MEWLKCKDFVGQLSGLSQNKYNYAETLHVTHFRIYNFHFLQKKYTRNHDD